MLDVIIEYLNNFPRGIATIILATLPITELRLAIPVAINIWLVHPLNAFGLALIGNFLPFFPLFFGLEKIRSLSQKHTPKITKYINAIVSRAESRVEKKYARYGALALFLFTAIPLPFTGLYTATIAAVALKVPLKYTLVGVVSGIIVAGIIVTILSLSVDVFF